MKRNAALAVAFALVAACSGDGDGGADTDPAATPASTGSVAAEGEPTVEPIATAASALGDDPRSVPDPLPEGEPGQLLALSPRSADDVPDGARAWDVLHLSSDVGDRPTAVTGVVYAPEGEAPAGGRPVLTWAHGTTGLADECAPTAPDNGVSVPYLERFLDAGFVVAATDYQGLGTPGVHHYLVGGSEGRGVLDVARAAAEIDGAGAGSEVVVYGHSQGGHAALFAGELAPSYAPDLDVLGVVAAAPPTELRLLLGATTSIPVFFGFLAASAYGYADAYPELDLTAVLGPAALDRIDLVEERCIGELLGDFADAPIEELSAANPLDLPDWAARVAENEPGAVALEAPVLVIQGTADAIVPAGTVDSGVARLCEGGTAIDYRRYEGADHGGVLGAAEADVLAWVADRLAGSPAASTCPA